MHKRPSEPSATRTSPLRDTKTCEPDERKHYWSAAASTEDQASRRASSIERECAQSLRRAQSSVDLFGAANADNKTYREQEQVAVLLKLQELWASAVTRTSGAFVHDRVGVHSRAWTSPELPTPTLPLRSHCQEAE